MTSLVNKVDDFLHFLGPSRKGVQQDEKLAQ